MNLGTLYPSQGVFSNKNVSAYLDLDVMGHAVRGDGFDEREVASRLLIRQTLKSFPQSIKSLAGHFAGFFSPENVMIEHRHESLEPEYGPVVGLFVWPAKEDG